MKILIATGIFPPQIGGPATYSKLLYDELPKKGINVEIANFGDYIDKPKLIRHFLYFRDVLNKSADVDVVYALDPVSAGLPALFASQIRKKRFMLRVAGDYAWEQGSQRFGVTDNLDVFARNFAKYKWQVKLLKKIEKYVAFGAEKIIVPSAYLKGIVNLWGVSTEKIKVVYNGFHMEKVSATPAVLRKKLKITGPVIISIGRLVPWKGMKDLIEIMPEIVVSIPDAKLLIAGDGPDKESLEKLADIKGVKDKVIFAGRLAQVPLFEYLKAADLFVLNTAYEGFSHQIIETMALGTPIITTAVGGNTEVIRNGENGILVAPGAKEALKEAILSLLTDTKRADGFARVAKKDVAKFTDEIMLETISKEF